MVRIVHQHLRDIALTERQTGLQQVAAIGAQHVTMRQGMPADSVS